MSLLRHRSRLPVTALAAGAALLLGLAPTAGAVETGEAYLGDVCVPDQVPDAPFSDRASLPAPLAVDCVASYGLTRGTTAGTYDGGAPVTRAQLARFAVRFGLLQGATFRADDGLGEYSDTVGADLELSGALAGLDGAGAMRGFPDGAFRPDQPVTRGQVATVLNNLQEFLRTDIRGLVDSSGERYYSSARPFDDTGDSVHAERIRRAWSAYVVQGVAARTYAPAAPVTRNQVARLLARVLSREVDPYVGVGFRPPLRDASETLATGDDGSVTPLGSVVLPQLDPEQRQDFDVTGLAAGVPVRLDLAAGATVLRRLAADDGPATTGWRFRPAAQDPAAADLGEVAARVVSVDGADVPSTASLTLVPGPTGRVTFEVAAGDADEVVVPVLHAGGRPDVLDLVPQPGDRGPYDRAPADAIAVAGEISVEGAYLLGNPPGAPPLPLEVVPLRSSGVSNQLVTRRDGVLTRLAYDNGDTFRYGGGIGAIDGFERLADLAGDPCRDVMVRVAYDPSRNGNTVWDVVRDEQVDSEGCPLSAAPTVGGER